MKLNLTKAWFEENLPHDNPEVGIGLPAQESNMDCTTVGIENRREGDFVEGYAFGALLRLLRREKKLTVDQLASFVQVEPEELIIIEHNPRYIPKPRTVFQISQYFHLPDRPLMELANVTTAHNDSLHDAAVRFAAQSSKVMELSQEERAALTEFVTFLASQGGD